MHLIERYLVVILLLGITTFFSQADFPIVYAENILGVSTDNVSTPPNETLDSFQPLQTESRFEEKLLTQIDKIEKKTTYKDDPETEAGEEKVLDEGKDGTKTKVIKITYYEGKEYERKTVSTETIQSQDKVIARGTKIVWRTLQTADGEITYWKKLRVYATHYDSHCLGCNEWTAMGMRAGKGVIAVDPKVIKLRSKVYIPGYGTAVAGDTGGAIKGNIIALGFEDARTAGWSARFVDIYLL